jgi:hypothetical protein
MNFVRPLLLLTAIALAGCANARQTYVSKHPELSPDQRQLFVSGKIPVGNAVSGLTRDQVALVMGGDPTSYDKAEGEDVWVYRRDKPVEKSPDEAVPSTQNSSNFAGSPGLQSPDDPSPRSVTDTVIVTKIFFKGDRATHAQKYEDKR